MNVLKTAEPALTVWLWKMNCASIPLYSALAPWTL